MTIEILRLRVVGGWAEAAPPIEATGSRLRVGRSPLNDLVLVDPEVAELHAVVSRERGRTLVEDLGGTCGVVHGDQRMRPGATIDVTADPLLRIGRASVLIEIEQRTPSVIPRATVPASVEAAVEGCRRAWADLYQATYHAVVDVPEDERSSLLEAILESNRRVALHDDFRRMAIDHGLAEEVVDHRGGRVAGALDGITRRLTPDGPTPEASALAQSSDEASRRLVGAIADELTRRQSVLVEVLAWSSSRSDAPSTPAPSGPLAAKIDHLLGRAAPMSAAKLRD